MEEISRSSFRLKLIFRDSVRVVMFPKQQTLEFLAQIIRKTFIELPTTSSISLRYEDGEGDSITVETTEGLKIALEDMSGSQAVPRFTIHSVTMSTAAPSETRKPCKFFLAGYCKHGSKCRFSHPSSAATVRPPLSTWEIERWLSSQMRRSSAENIEELSSPQGIQMLSSVASSMNLTNRAASALVQLLTKDNVRSSMLKQETNKIFGSLAESRFVMQLQVYMNNLMPRTDENLRSYVLLMEELQLRTGDGWKYLPLDAAEKLVMELPETPRKVELVEKMEALLEHRRKLRLLMATSTRPDESLQGPEFRKVPIIPTKEELLSSNRILLPVNKVGMRYRSVVEYLETHFQLLREDFIEPLRTGIKHFKNHHEGYQSEVRIYSNVQLQGVRSTINGMESRVSFVFGQGRNRAKEVDWGQTKRLMFGSLLCVTSDNFETFIWATVTGRSNLSGNEVDVRILDGCKLEASVIYTMVESTAAYFEAYSYVLKSLQREDMENMPFMRHLISLEKYVKEPVYLSQRQAQDIYDFSSAFPEIGTELGRSDFHILQDWPEWDCTLDSSQKAALKHSLTKNLALIQGPPGTGKTYIGLLIVKLLLANFKEVPHPTNDDGADLILIVCYTNHALDQFLQGVYGFEKNVIRIGSRSKSTLLDSCNMHYLMQQAREKRELQGPHARAAAKAREDRKRLDEELRHCVNTLNLIYVTADHLHGVATEDQIARLFFDRKVSTHGVATWLEGGTRPRPHSVDDRNAAGGPNRFDLLRDQHSDSSDGSETENLDYESDIEEMMVELDEITEAPSTLRKKDDRWLQVKNRQRKGDAAPEEPEGAAANIHAREEELPLEMFVDYPDVWSLPHEERQRLHEYWLDEIHGNAQRELTRLTNEYEAACNQCKAADSEIQLNLLRKARVIGMTTTAAARLHDILVTLKPEIVVVEEAAEVLESHVLACLSPSTKHLILIGDHLQLRPSVATYHLAKRHKLDVSLFERLVQSGVEHAMLKTQRRMKPCIAKLVSPIYPRLRNHPSVLAYEDIKGMKSSLFFLDHEAPENAGHESGSKVNLAEARLIVELCAYLLNQAVYGPDDITILAMYKGQVQEISRRLKDRLHCHSLSMTALGQVHGESASFMPRVSSVDDFQGEENEIILLSLVRSNLVPGKEEDGTIGFLNIPNRVCVALSRARKGLYIFGNAQLLSRKSPLWKVILGKLGQDGLIGPKLVLCCQNHPGVETHVQLPEDFIQVGDGGCSNECGYQLECGHVCPRRCHPTSHDAVICPKRCLKPYGDCSHRCKNLCHGKGNKACPPCGEQVMKTIPGCGHTHFMQCSKNPEEVTCPRPCEKLLSCGHKCSRSCGNPCAKSCHTLVHKQLPCGHATDMECAKDPKNFSCSVPCREILPGCEHPCGGSCSQCKQQTQHIPCQQKCNRDLVCGHQCKARCSVSCPPCPQRCQKRCLHSKCATICGAPCKPCLETCSWQCEHFSCNLLCYEVCQRPRCDKPCMKLLKCRHLCIGLCGEPCPRKCRVCHPKTFDVISQMTLEESDADDKFIQLVDCGHVFEVTGLDQWMDMDNSDPAGSQAIVLKPCPECKTPIRRSFRYANVVKTKLQQIELVKMKVYGYEQAKEGMEMLSNKQYVQARQLFLNVIKVNPGVFEAHLGIAQALCKLQQFKKAVIHLRFLVDKSSLAFEVANFPMLELEEPYHAVARSADSRLIGAPSHSLTIQALVLWGSALTALKEFVNAVRLCEIALKHDKENSRAQALKIDAQKGVTHQVVEAVSAEFGARGHWFQCPNGHIYSVGECGGPMETSRCPDCGSVIGGRNHASAPGNRHSNIDGSSRALYSNDTGLGNIMFEM